MTSLKILYEVNCQEMIILNGGSKEPDVIKLFCVLFMIWQSKVTCFLAGKHVCTSLMEHKIDLKGGSSEAVFLVVCNPSVIEL
jgi:hypothetical protein